MTTKKIAIITGSSRVNRVGDKVADFVHKTVLTSTATPKVELSSIDIADFNLPVFNEGVVPAAVPKFAQFEYEHSKKWSAAIAVPDAYILVSPEYNFGVPGPVKNAFDYLYNELTGKPILIVTYGGAGGNNSSDAWKTILTGMKLNVLEDRPQLKFADFNDTITAGGGQLGEKTRGNWEAEYKEPILKAYQELVTAVHTQAPQPVPET